MSTQFQKSIEHLLKSHNLFEAFQNQSSFHVRFDMKGYQRLVIERHDDMMNRSALLITSSKMAI